MIDPRFDDDLNHLHKLADSILAARPRPDELLPIPDISLPEDLGSTE